MNSSRLFSTIPLLSRFQARWPEPELSTERYRGIKKGKLHCWDATGPARDAFEQIRQEISDHLSNEGIQVPSSSIIMFDMFMIGKSQVTARPYIIFSCKHRESRKAAVTAIRESNILEQCPPGIGIGDWDYPPHLKNLRQLALCAVNPDAATDTIQADETDIDLYTCRVYSVVDLKSGMVRALRLATRKESAKDGHPCMVTIGSIIEIHGRKFYLVPAHIFNTTAPGVMSEETNILSEDSECDLDDFDSDTENFQDEAEFMSQYSASPDASDGEEDWDLDDGTTISDGDSIQGFDERSQQSPSIEMTTDGASASVNDMELYSTGHFAFSMNRPPHLSSLSLDYCLIEVDDGEKISKDVPVLSRDTIGQLNRKCVNVLAVTGSGNVLKGVLCSRSSCIRLPNATKYINVLSVQFEGSLRPGDCGSIVRDANTGKIYGHLVAGDTDSQVAFIVQAADVLDNVMAKLPEPEAVSVGQKASTSPSPQLLPIESINQGSNGSLFGVSCLVYAATEDWLSPDSPPDLPSLANEDNDPSFGETRPVAQAKPHGRNATRNSIREGLETPSGGSIAAGAKKKRRYLEDTTNGPGTKSAEPMQEYSPCEPDVEIVIIYGLGGLGRSWHTTWAPKMRHWPFDLFSETVRQTYPRNHSTYDMAERSLESTPANIQCLKRLCGQTFASRADVNSRKQWPQNEDLDDLPTHESGNLQTHRVYYDLMLDDSLCREEVLEPALTDPLLGSGGDGQDIVTEPRYPHLTGPVPESCSSFTVARMLEDSDLSHSLAVFHTISSLLSSLFRNGPCSADIGRMDTGSTWADDCFFNTGVNFNLASHKHSEANGPRTAHQGDDARPLVSHGFDTMKPLQHCPCERDSTNRHVLKGVFKRHVEEQHFPPLKYQCNCFYCHHNVRTQFHSDHHKFPFSCGDPCSARSLCRHQRSGVLRYRHLPLCAERLSKSIGDALFSETSARILDLEHSWTASCSNERRRPSPCPEFYDCFIDHCLLRRQHIDWTAVASPSRPAQIRFLFNGTFYTWLFVHRGVQLNFNHQGIESSHITTLINDEESQARTRRSNDPSAAAKRSDSLCVNIFSRLVIQTSSVCCPHGTECQHWRWIFIVMEVPTREAGRFQLVGIKIM